MPTASGGELAGMAGASLLVHLQVLGVAGITAPIGDRLMLGLVRATLTVVAGRIMPFFPRTGIPGAEPSARQPVESFNLGLNAFWVASDAFADSTAVAGAREKGPRQKLKGEKGPRKGAVANIRRVWPLWCPRDPSVCVLAAVCRDGDTSLVSLSTFGAREAAFPVFAPGKPPASKSSKRSSNSPATGQRSAPLVRLGVAGAQRQHPHASGEEQKRRQEGRTGPRHPAWPGNIAPKSTRTSAPSTVTDTAPAVREWSWR